MRIFRTGIGQDSHRFLSPEELKPCMIGGLSFEGAPGLKANSDGDVVLHAICNAITSLTGVIILGGIADELCNNDGITDSEVYLAEAVKTLGEQRISHVSITIEALKPKILPRIDEMKENIARILRIPPKAVGITATTGEGLTDFGCGGGIQCFCIVTSYEELEGEE